MIYQTISNVKSIFLVAITLFSELFKNKYLLMMRDRNFHLEMLFNIKPPIQAPKLWFSQRLSTIHHAPLIFNSNYVQKQRQKSAWKLFKKTFYISGETFSSMKNKKTLWKKLFYFWEMELSSPKIKKFVLTFQEGTCKAWKSNIFYISLHIFICWERTFQISLKEKSFWYFSS